MTPTQRRYRIARHRSALVRARNEIGELGCGLPEDPEDLKAVSRGIFQVYENLNRLIAVLEDTRS
jgi:hypothetical protein